MFIRRSSALCRSSLALESCDLGCTLATSAYDAKKNSSRRVGRGFIGKI